MDASCSSRFSIAKVVEAVAEMEAMTMVGAEGASTSGRPEYYSARCEDMMRSRGQFSDDVELQIAFSTSHCSEVSGVEVVPQTTKEKKLNRENGKLLKRLCKKYPKLFNPNLGRGYSLGRMIAEGGQAKIYEVVDKHDCLMKVFARGISLRDLQRLMPLPVLTGDFKDCIMRAGMLEDGRFVFLMWRFWGDLRKLIDLAMLEKNVDGIQGPPFPYKWKIYNRWIFYREDFMFHIAKYMCELHKKGVSHRDLKASNILLKDNFEIKYGLFTPRIVVADFECSIGVLGTGFWRAPEVLATLGKQDTLTNEQWKQADVYSYGMTCFELVTGRIPFDNELGNTKFDHRLVIEGKRPRLPSDLDDASKDLITKCWDPNPCLRPTFLEIVEMVETISTRPCQFRLFGISDELPPLYHLATVQEVDDYPEELSRVMRRWEIANLANGSVDGYLYGMKIRSRRRSDVGHKLARLHYYTHLSN